MAFAGDRLDVAHGKILELLLHGVVGLLFAAGRITTQRYWVGSTDGGGRRHRGDACGNGNEATGTGRGRTCRSNVNDHWQRRPQKALHDRLRRVEQAARSVELNDKTLCVLRPSFLDTPRNVA